MTQNEFKLSSDILEVITELGYSEWTDIQKLAIPLLLSEKDVTAQSKTGSGKTAAYVVPILQKIKIKNNNPQALVLCPTRELAAQVLSEFRKIGKKIKGLKVVSLVGGVPGRDQAESLRGGAHIIVGTPGRVLDHTDKGRIDYIDLKFLIVDEADKMLDMGFQDEIEALFDSTPQTRQTVFFSATYPEGIQTLSKKYQINPVFVKTDEAPEENLLIEHLAYEIDDGPKINTLMRILQQHVVQSTIIFCNQKATIASIVELLSKSEASFAELHGDMEQRDRDRVMALFKNGSCRILVATDVASRGLDINNLDLVINYDLPQQPEIYIHRIGRTGRAGKSGLAISIVKPTELIKINDYVKQTGQKIKYGKLGFKNQHALGEDYKSSTMKTISIGGGRKDKLRPGDILGALTSQPNPIEGTHIGKIDVQDRFSLVAISSPSFNDALEKLRSTKIKGSKFSVRST